MTLRDDSFYIRLSTFHDVLDDAAHLEALEQLHELNGGLFATFHDIAARGRPRPVTPDLLLDKLHGYVGAGLNALARFRLQAEAGAASPVRSFELNAGPHPYSGRYVTHVEVRLDRPWMLRNGAPAARRASRLLRALAALARPYQAHAHDTDDDAIQNIGSASMLLRGYGVEVAEPIDLADNPGRELARGEYRYCVNWMTLLGPGLLDHLGVERALTAPACTVEELALGAGDDARRGLAARFEDEPASPRWVLLTLDGDPLDPGSLRPAQRAVREHLNLRALAAAERRDLGYWQRKA